MSTAIVTTIGVTGATVVYGVIARRSGRPNRLFVHVAVAAPLLSFSEQLLLLAADGPATDEILVLVSLHLPPGAACVTSLSGFER